MTNARVSKELTERRKRRGRGEREKKGRGTGGEREKVPPVLVRSKILKAALRSSSMDFSRDFCCAAIVKNCTRTMPSIHSPSRRRCKNEVQI